MVKSFLLNAILFFAYSGVSSQTATQLDAKNGFKHFILGSPLSNYLSEVSKSGSCDPNPKISCYEYTGGRIVDLFGVPIEQIRLTFYDKKLSNIQITFGSNSDSFEYSEYEKILYSLEKLYGKSESLSIADPNFILKGGQKWTGKKVTLELLRLYHLSSQVLGGYISINDIKLHEKRFKDEF